MTEMTEHFQWGSFFIGIIFTTAIVFFIDLIRTKRNLGSARLEIESLKKKQKKKKEKGKGKGN